MRKILFAFLLTLTLLLPTAAFGQAVKISGDERKMAEAITAEQLSHYLYFVASDAMGGRDTPSYGLDITAEFLKMNLSRWGFKPAGDDGTFFQRIALRRDAVDPMTTAVTIGGQKYAYGDEIIRVTGNSSAPLNAKLVYAGDGWMIKSKGLDPYKGLDVKGKIIVITSENAGPRGLVGLPQGIKESDLTGARGKDWADATLYARENGAVGVMILASKFMAENWGAVTANFGRSRLVVDRLATAAMPTSSGATQPTIFLASAKVSNALFAGETANPMSGAAPSFEISKDFNFSLATKAEMQWTQNVVAVWEGSDSALKGEMVAVGAHYDHDGIKPNAPGEDKIWNGADDDGSGTVAVLAIAEALAKAKSRPKRSVLLVWHAGEEKGLWGSEYFNKFPTVDIKNVVAQLNIDMIGRSKKAGDTNPKNKDLTGENAIYVIGSEMMSSTLGAITKATNDSFLKLAYDYKYDDPKDTNRFFFRSDHYHYAVNGIPISFWFDGVHEDYHQATDTADKIDYKKMEKVTRTIFLTMLELADLKERPRIDKTLPPELTRR
ncbi:MAG: M28 family peptidase [Pyrinomonadaceae bacterium]